MNQDAFFGNLYDLFSTPNDGNSIPMDQQSMPKEPILPPISTPVSWQISSPKQSQVTQLTDTYQPSSVFSYSKHNDNNSSFLSDDSTNKMNFLNRFTCLSVLEKTFCGVACGASIFIILIVVVLLITTFQHKQYDQKNKKVKETEQENDIN
jgi:hypothetical protein